MRRTGVYRKLVLSHFFPHVLLDRVHYSVQKGGNLYDLIEHISTNGYWSTENVNSVCVLLVKEQCILHTHMSWGSNSMNLIHIPWVLGGSRVYEEEDMWYDMKRLILKSDDDYEKLLKKLVLDYI